MQHEGHPDLLTTQLMAVVGNQLVVLVDAPPPPPHPVVVIINHLWNFDHPCETVTPNSVKVGFVDCIHSRLLLLSGVCIVVTMVTTLLSTHRWIWKLSLSLIQYKELKRSSKIFLYSFSGQPRLALAVPQMATFIALAPERTLDKVKRLSTAATYCLNSFWGNFPSNNKTESMIFLPSTLPVRAVGM